MQGLVYGSDWFKVYDIIEALHAAMVRNDQKDGSNDARKFGEELNAYFLEEGIGWQLVDGQVVTRGTETFEATVTGANKALEASNRPTAAGHIHEALMDLSRRPAADLSGAVYHDGRAGGRRARSDRRADSTVDEWRAARAEA